MCDRTEVTCKWFVLMGVMAFVHGCAGSEAGNPETLALCDSFMFGLIEGDFDVPQNAAAIPLQFSEQVQARATSTLELNVTVDGQPLSAYSLQQEDGGSLDASEPINGVALFVPENPLREGSVIALERAGGCLDGDGELLEVWPSEVTIRVRPSQPEPSSAGMLQTESASTSLDVGLSLSAELVPWRHLITRAYLRVGGERLSTSWLTSDEDRTFEWSLASEGCRACSETMTDPARDASRVLACQAHQWEAGAVELLAEVELAGGSAPLSTVAQTQTLETTHCSP